MSDPITAALLAALDIAVLEPIDDDRLRVVGHAPAWLTNVFGDVGGPDTGFRPQQQSPFLDNFLVDARRCWQRGDEIPQHSGVWIEVDGSGADYCLEATACCVEGRALLAIEHTKTVYQRSVGVLQRARENALHFQQLVKEIEKKDVLLHCIVHDLRSPLVSVQSLLRLLHDEPLAEKTRDLVDVGRTQLDRQDLLIRTILDVFAADLSAVVGDAHETSDIVSCARDAVQTFAPLFELHNVALSLEVGETVNGGVDVVGEPLRLFRVFANLVENALRHSKGNASVTIRIRRDGDEVVATVLDEGPGVDPSRSDRLFDRFSQLGNRPGNAGLGLHFCRITVEGWGGSIGQRNRSEGGSEFWFRLPSVSTRDR